MVKIKKVTNRKSVLSVRGFTKRRRFHRSRRRPWTVSRRRHRRRELFRHIRVTVDINYGTAASRGFIITDSNSKTPLNHHSLIKPYTRTIVFIANSSCPNCAIKTTNFSRVLPLLCCCCGGGFRRRSFFFYPFSGSRRVGSRRVYESRVHLFLNGVVLELVEFMRDLLTNKLIIYVIIIYFLTLYLFSGSLI